MNPSDVKQVGKWQVVRLIGQGGMSWVFEVVNPRVGVVRALKMLKPAAASTAGYKGFLREAQILASIYDDFLVRIDDLDKDPETGNDYYVMELLSGSDLKQLLKAQGPLEAERAKAIFADVLQALGKLHAQSPPIIHRDIKPGNIQITESGRPKLLDLGIAKVTRKNSEETVFGDDSTVADMFKGTVLYASPEQLAMQESGPQSDVFAMGLCMYESLEGRHAYAGIEGLPDPTNSHVLYQDVFRFYTRLEAVAGRLKVEFKRTPKPLQTVIRKALEIEPRLRFSDANEMRAALLNPESVASRPTVEEVVRPKSEPVPRKRKPEPAHEPERLAADTAGRPSNARTWKMALAGVAIVAGLGGLAYELWPTPLPPPHADAGEQPSQEQVAARDAAEARVRAASVVQSPPATEALRSARATLEEGRTLWTSSDFAAAATKFNAADAKAREALKIEKGDERVLAIARDKARELNAEVNSAEDWHNGEASQNSGRIPEAIQAFTQASESSQRLIDSATSGQAAAENGRRAIPGECAAAAGGAETCRRGEAALAKGKLALQERRASDAIEAFGVATRAFDEIGKAPFRLTVEPSGPIALEVGTVKRFKAATTPAGATVRYSVQPPGGAAPYAASGSSYAFVPGQPGEYEITVSATDAQGRQAASIVIAATAREGIQATNHRPTLRMSHQGTIERKVGETTEFRANPADVDGGKTGVKFTVAKPTEAPAIPAVFQEIGDARVLRFTPTMPGPYTFTFWANDAAGAESERVAVRVVVTADVSPPSETAAGPSPVVDDRLAEARTLLQRFRAAIEGRDMNRLRMVWKIDAESAEGFQHLFDSADDIKVVADPIGPIQLKGGDKAELRFRQRVTTTMDGETQDIVPLAPYRAELLRRSGSWQIIGLKQD
jgi:serine/threonine-protein kinase